MWLRDISLMLLLGAAFPSATLCAAEQESSRPESTQPAASPVADNEKSLTVDTPILDLLMDARTRPVLERHLPTLTKRLLEDETAAEFLGNSSPRELAIDPHVRGITAETLARLRDDLLAAQKPR